jgi:hypothetical protein
MRSTSSLLPLASLVFGVIACSSTQGGGDLGLGNDSGTGDFDVGGGGGDTSGQFDVSSEVDTGSSCDPPDMLIVLDRTDSMSQTPAGTRPPNTPAGRATTKWFLAVDAVDNVTAAVDTTVRFGLELMPQDPGGGACVTVQTLLSGKSSTNPSCQPGQVVIEPALGTGAAIKAAIPADTSLLCISTPIGAALQTASTELAKIKVATRKQFVVFVSDGGDTCGSKVDPLMVTDGLFGAGVGTYIISFDASSGGGGINMKLLNDMACAGGTANPATSCTAPPKSRANAGITTPLYYTATDEKELVDKLKHAVGDVCCSCGIH